MNDRRPFLDQRTALILALGVVSAIGTGVLTKLNGSSTAAAALAACGAFTVAVLFFHTLID